MNNKKIKIEIEDDENNIYYLSQEDFNKGPYRIKKSGTYIITENIIFDFNKDSDYPYWPEKSQNDEYPGSGQYRDQYFTGFFAGITIESNDVTIDLNGYELSQSFEFYFQQRWFAIIELSSSQFLPGQGPGFFGYNPIFINNFKLKNGKLGLTSHFGIHGNYPTNIIIENVHVYNFATHGIQLNGWENLIINNCEIGPSSTYEYLLGDYGHARVMLPRLWDLLDLYPDNHELYIKYVNRDEALSLMDIADELELQMLMAYTYALNRINNEFIDNDYLPYIMTNTDKKKELWSKAKLQFINENGLPSATSLTGIFLNLHSVSVNSYTIYTDRKSKNAKLSNIKIHDLKHSLHESIRMTLGDISTFVGPLGSFLDTRYIFGSEEKLIEFYNILNEDSNAIIDNTYFKYDGLILIDTYIALEFFGNDDWDILSSMFNLDIYGHTLKDWALGDITDEDRAETEHWNFGCNQDIMMHSGKGILGLRIDGSYNINIKNIDIYNLYQETELGLNVCGEYSIQNDITGGGGHVKQATPMQTGFSGNNLQGISIIGSENIIFDGYINMYNLNNNYGDLYGISFWPSNNIIFNNNLNINMYNIKTGILLENEDNIYTYESRPNRASEVCGIRFESGEEFNDDRALSTFLFNNNNDNILLCNINGYVSCFDNDDYKDTKTMMGNYYESCDDINMNDNIENKQFFITINKNLESSSLIALIVLIIIIGIVFIFACKFLFVFLCKFKQHKKSIVGQANYGTIPQV